MKKSKVIVLNENLLCRITNLEHAIKVKIPVSSICEEALIESVTRLENRLGYNQPYQPILMKVSVKSEPITQIQEEELETITETIEQEQEQESEPEDLPGIDMTISDEDITESIESTEPLTADEDDEDGDVDDVFPEDPYEEEDKIVQ